MNMINPSSTFRGKNVSTNTAVKEKPILFSAPMVRAILEDRKTMTRRAIKDKPIWADKIGFDAFCPKDHAAWRGVHFELGPCEKFVKIPFPVGTRLWIRETFSLPISFDKQSPKEV